MSNFLFRPINAFSRGLRSNTTTTTNANGEMKRKQDKNEATLLVADDDDDKKRAASETTKGASTYVSPPPEELLVSLEQTEKHETSDMAVDKAAAPEDESVVRTEKAAADKDKVAACDDSATNNAPPPRKKRKKKRNELDNLVSWDVLASGTVEPIRTSRRAAAASLPVALPVTPSPSKRAARKVAPKKYQENENDMAAVKKENAIIFQRGRPRDKKATRRGPKKKSKPQQAPTRKMPSRNASGKVFAKNGSFVYYDDDSEESDGDLSKKPAAVRRRASKRKLVEWSSSDDESWSEDDYDNRKKSGPGHPIHWSDEEKLLLLYGIREYGRGKWTLMAKEFLRTKSALQIKWRGQKLCKKAETTGVDIFAPLEGQEEVMEEILSRRRKRSPVRKFTEEERLLFLFGLKRHGRGKWQQIHEEFLPNWSRHEIRHRARKFLEEMDEGKDIFAPLEGMGDLLEELVARQHRAVAKAVAGPIVSVQPPAPVPKSYNAAVIERMSLAKVSAGMPKSALKLCSDTLTSWYSDASESLGREVRGGAYVSASLRDGIAKLWCVYAELIAAILEQPEGTSQSQMERQEWSKLEVTLLDMARSCPLAGNNSEIIRARLKLEYGEYTFLETMDSDTLEGFTEAVKSVDAEDAKILKILSSAISVCNGTVQTLSGERTFSPGTELSTAGPDANEHSGELALQHRYLILSSMAALADSVASLQSTWRSSLHVVDQQSTVFICKEANRLSRIKEAILESNEDPMGTEYGCGCWSLFATKRELFEHQKSCRGGAAAIGEHERFERAKISDRCSIRPVKLKAGTKRKQVRALKKLEATTLKTKGGMKNFNVGRLPCWEVEYGCSQRGCSCVFETEKELLEHQLSCGDHEGATRSTQDSGDDTRESGGSTMMKVG